jgi:predicted amidohydrolase
MVQPRTFPDDEINNVGAALSYVDDAADDGGKIVCFPEGYPGPFWERFHFHKKPRKYDWLAPMSKKAKERGVYVIAGGLEDIGRGKYFDFLKLIGPDGKLVGRYNRTTPMGPYLFDAGYEVGDSLPVFQTKYGKVGMLTCSEVYEPELSRVLALQGAEMIFLPSGGLIGELWPTWKTLVWARAIENLAYTGTCQHMFGVEDGIAMVAGPEGVVAEKKDEGVLTVDIDLSRSRWLRKQQEEITFPKKYRVVPGTLDWRRPDLYRKSYPRW